MDALLAELDRCLLVDRMRLRRRLEAARGDPSRLETVSRQVRLAVERRARRDAARPELEFDPSLPIAHRREEIAEAIRRHPVVVVCGETGSGKTTQLPKICLSIGRGSDGLIGHTQPRRIAARSVAARLAEELRADRVVGYKIRFGDRTSDETLVKLMTDGILLAETQSDRLLAAYDTLIIDEAHERSLNIDFILGYLRHLLPRRPDLRVVITSATIDPQRFSTHFGGAPIIEVSGRTYPIEVRYRPVADGAMNDEPAAAILSAVDELAREGQGDVLVFLPGEREIREAAEALRKHHPPRTQVLPLYARLSADEQMRVFQPHPGRRIVLATNVAETSLTVPGIRYVVDTGLARLSRFNSRTRVLRLPIEPVSRASADQRAGRCGRLGPGVCIRLYEEADYRGRPAFTDPEILRTNLAGAILQMKALNLGEPETFPFVEAPEARAIRDAYDTLWELNALDEQRRLTPTGATLARLPVDPRLGRMILAADTEACLDEVLVIAAALSVQDPRERPMAAAEQADLAHAAFRDDRSDFLGILKLWRFYHEQESRLSRSKLRRACVQNFLSFTRMREWIDIHRQLLALVTEMGVHRSSAGGAYEPLHKALLAGLLSSVGKKAENNEYAGCRGTKPAIFPGSGLFHKPPRWMMAAELVQTTRLWARTVAGIEPEWIESLASHLVKRTYSEPHYREEGAFPAVYEKVLLLGLEIVPHRLVSLGPIDERLARELFIRHGLVEGQLDTGAPFQRHNRQLLEEVRALQSKARRVDLLADDAAIFEFFDKRLPPHVWSGSRLARWRRTEERSNPKVLCMTRETLLAHPEHVPSPEAFPDRIPLAGLTTPLRYRFEPGDSRDGITITVPVEALPQLDAARGEWLVPGMLAEKIEALVRALPKSLRKNFGSVTDFARACAAKFTFGEGALHDLVLAEIERAQGLPIPADAWHDVRLPDHLRPLYRVVDAGGTELACSRDLDALKRDLRPRAASALAALARRDRPEQRLTDWSIGDLPDHVDLSRSGVSVRAYPALVDEGSHAALRVFVSESEAREVHGPGTRRLLALALREELRAEQRLLPEFQSLAVRFAVLAEPRALREALQLRIVERAGIVGPIRTRRAFDEALTRARERLDSASKEVGELTGEVLSAHQRVALRVAELTQPVFATVVRDAKAQLASLVGPGFLARVAWDRLVHYPRYLGALEIRLVRAARAGLERDARLAAQVAPFAAMYASLANAHADHSIYDPELERLRWMIEEFRVSLFAQDLRTIEPVSPKRLDEQAARVRRV